MAKKEASKKVVDDIKPAAPVAAPAPAPSKDVLKAGEEIIERLGMRFIRNVDEGTIRRI
tara:strand:- start:245 stop:421 length:177 start_codon:yes stop_codon:yes gene_type:complete